MPYGAVRVRMPFVLFAVLLFLSFAVPSAHAAWQRGANFNTYTPGAYGTAGADASLARLQSDGNDSVAIVTTWYQSKTTSNSIAPDPTRSPTDASVVHAMERARALGLKVTLKPHVNVNDGTWRGLIMPTDGAAWWASYRAMINHYANLAKQGGATMLVVGTEMKSMTLATARWQTVIADARARFSGKLTYAANYDEFQQIGFWSSLDYVGVDAYFALTNVVGDTVATLKSRWTTWGWEKALADVSAAAGKPVLFTEIGYRSTADTALHPGMWGTPDSVDLAGQAKAYEAFYQAFENETWFAGAFWWNWPAQIGPSPGWDNDYPPIGKPAEDIMKSWNARLGPATAAAPAPAAPATASTTTTATTTSPVKMTASATVKKRRR
jgi:hypothetical protein